MKLKFLCLLLAVFSLTVSEAFADVNINSTNFPDKNFREIVSADFDTDQDGILSESEIEAVTEINVSNKNIARLNGIEFFTKLQILSCDQNNITNIDLSKNTELVSLNCSWNYLTRLDVSNSPNLNTLSCARNDITVLNVSNTSLTSLKLDAGFFITKGYTYRSPLTGIYARNCAKLEKLLFNDQELQIGTLDLSGCVSLNIIDLPTNYRNRYQGDDYTYIKNINLSSCTALENLSGIYNAADSRLYGLGIESLDLSGCTALVSLDVSRNNLKALDVSDCTALENLDCSQNKLTMLDLSKNTALTSVKCVNQTAESQKINSSGNSEYKYKFDFSKLIPSENILQVVSDTVHGYTSEGAMVEMQYSDGVVMFKKIPAEIEYEFSTGLGDTTLLVKFSVTTGSSSGIGESEIIKAPVIQTTVLEDAIIKRSYVIELIATGTPTIVWELTSGDLPDGLDFLSNGIIRGAPQTLGTFEFTVKAENDAGDDSVTLNLTVSESQLAAAPDITSTSSSLEEGTVDSPYGCYIRASGVRPLTWDIIESDSGLGWLNIDENGQLTGTPTESGDFNFTVQAQNSEGTVSKDLTITINPAPLKIKPTILTSELEPAVVGLNYGPQLMASGTPPIKWSITKPKKLPKDLEFSSNGSFSGIITRAQKAKITVKAENEYGSFSKIFTLQSYVVPNIDLSSLKDAKVWKNYNLSFRTKPTATKPLTWNLEGTLPPGLAFDASKGRITGTPSLNKSYNLTVKASNPAGTDVQDFILNVAADLPKFTLSQLPAGTDGKSYKAVVKATGSKTITYKIADGYYLPSGLNFDTSTGKISGTPTEVCTGRKIKIIASNMGGDTAKEYYLTINGVAPKFTTKSLANGLLSSEYSAPVAFTGTKPVNISVSGLPKGLEFNADENAITGTPAELGTFSIILTASNIVKEVTKKFKLNIVSPPSLNNVTLSDATAGENYKGEVTAEGTKKITYSIIEGSLPSGIKLNASSGKLTGKPTSAGNFNFTVKAANSYGSDSKEFSLTVKAVAPTITTTSMKKGTVGKAYNFTFKTSKKTTAPVTWIIDEDLPGLEINSGTGVLSGTPTAVFNGNITVRATNSAQSVSKNFTLVIEEVKNNAKNNKSVPEIETLSRTPLLDAQNAQKLFVGNPRKISDVKNLKLLDTYKIAAVLPEISVTESGFYDLEAEISEDIEIGEKLIYLALPQNSEPSEDDEIAEFYNLDGKEISTVPGNHKIIIGAWFNKNIIYAPVIAVKKE